MEKCSCVVFSFDNETRLKRCPLHEAAPMLLAALAEGILSPANFDFADDLDTIADQLGSRLPVYADKIRAKAQAIRAAVAAARGE